MLIGADVTHKAAGVSIAGVVASRDKHFAGYFTDMRAQLSRTFGTEKQRLRQSEERVLELDAMVSSLVLRWRSANGGLPSVVLYYRDGVSNGQFQPVLTNEHHQLTEAFRSAGRSVGDPQYNPELVIIVCQKRHQTRFFLDPSEVPKGKGKSKGKFQSNDGKGKGNGAKRDEEPRHLEAGTVASKGIATLGNLNFYLVSQKGLKGTSVPCHYHVLHMDPRLELRADDVERITYDLCHLYSRADKTVSYAPPAYFADHLCERGKLYLETTYGSDDSFSSLANGSSEEERLRELDTRVKDFNSKQAAVFRDDKMCLQGLNLFC